MKVIQVALLIAIFSTGLSAVNAMSELTGEDWFSQKIDPGIPEQNWESLSGSVSDTEVSTDSTLEYIKYMYTVPKTLLKILTGVFYIVPTIETIFYFNINGTNVGSIIGWIVQIGIYAIYGIGGLQLLSKDTISDKW